MMNKKINIAYIGGGSRLWARTLMGDLAHENRISGEIRLYDIDHEAAKDNQKIGMLYQNHEEAKGDWTYIYASSLEEALEKANFVIISIMPATFKEMAVYAHHPEKYGIYQSVADTTGPAGVMRGLIAIPIFVEFAKAIQKICPEAWVINFTNPMTLCLQALYEGFSEIKAYGNCHEVFGSQKDLADIYNDYVGEKVAKREDIEIVVSGINHFTWITKMSCKGVDLYPLYDTHVKKYGDPNYEEDPGKYKRNAPFGSAAKIKYDLYHKFNCMAAAGDRHLAEFMPVSYYLKDQERRDYFKFNLTPVSWRVDNLKRAIEKTKRLINHEETINFYHSGEEGVRQIRALCGLENFVTNVNFINLGQAEDLPLGQVVETNALFRFDQVQPVSAGKLPLSVSAMVKRHMTNHQLVMQSYREKSFNQAITAMANDPLCAHLSYQEVKQMFDEMVNQMRPYLTYYGDKL
jgi:galacturan 1,4-alpha-galacturonidase